MSQGKQDNQENLENGTAAKAVNFDSERQQNEKPKRKSSKSLLRANSEQGDNPGDERQESSFIKNVFALLMRSGGGHLIVLIVLLLVFLFVILAVREILLPFILSIVIAYIFAPVIEWLHKRRIKKRAMPRWVAVIFIYLVGGFSIYIFSLIVVPKFSSEFSTLINETPEFFRKASQVYIPQVNEKLNNFMEDLRTPFSEEEESIDPIEKAKVLEPEDGLEPETEVDKNVEVLVIDDGSDVPVTEKNLDEAPQKTLIVEKDAEVESEGELEPEIALIPRGTELEIENLGEGRYRVRSIKLKSGLGKSRQGNFELVGNLDDFFNALLRRSEAYVLRAFDLGQSFVRTVVGSVMTLVLTFMLAAFLLVDIPRVTGFFRSLVPSSYREEYDEIMSGINRGLGGVIRGQLMICLVNGTLTGIGLVFLGVKYAYILAMFAAILSLVPIFGTIISSVPSVGIALTQSFGLGFATLIWIVIIHLIEANLLNPKIIGTSARIHPAWVVFALVAGESAYGIFGALLAVPIFSIFQTLFLYFRQRAYGE